MEKFEEIKAWVLANKKKAGLMAFAALFVVVFVVSPSQIGNDGSGKAATPTVNIR